VHRDVVRFPDGVAVTAVSFDDTGYHRGAQPDYGVYLDARWQPPWPHELVEWPDFGLPADKAAFATAMSGALARARAGETVELGCLGGHGRTGTALAWLAMLSGISPDEAIGWVRANYCPHAVETAEQHAFVASFR